MQVGVSSRILWEAEENLAVNLDFLSKFADVVELWMMPPFFPSWRASQMKGDLDRLKDVLTVYGLKTTIHAPHHDMNLASLNPAAASCAVREVEKCLEVADLFGSSVVTFHPGSFRYKKEKGLLALNSNLKRLDAEAKKHSALLCMENMMAENMFCRGSEEIVQALEGLESINVTLDIAHAMSQPEGIGEYVKRLEGRVRHVHIADFKDNIHNHLPIGEGDLDITSAYRALKDVGFDGMLNLEGASKNPRATIPEDVKRLKKMLEEAGLK
jgi:sugar phosphate isomerase/epimerase